MNVPQSFLRRLLILPALAMSFGVTTAKVVVNEIFYHAPSAFEGLQWVEVHNTGPEPADVSGWTLGKAVQFRFPAQSVLPPGGYLVAASDAKVFGRTYGAAIRVVGPFEKPLKPGGGKIELSNAQGTVMDIAQYDDRAPWPAAPDGEGASLERITPGENGETPDNWNASVRRSKDQPAGTPGAQNSQFSATLPPVIQIAPALPARVAPDAKIPVRVTVRNPDDVASISVEYRVLRGTSESKAEKAAMIRNGAEFVAELPGQPALSVVRVQILAESKTGAKRWQPSATDLQPAHSILVAGSMPETKVAQVHLLGSTSGGARRINNEWSPEDQMRWSLQRLFQLEANLYKLWADLSISNALDPGQLGKLMPQFKAQMNARNEVVRKTLDVDAIAMQRRAVELAVTQVRSNTAAAIRPHLNAQQTVLLDRWAKPTGKGRNPNVGFNTDDMLQSWLNMEVQYFQMSAVNGLTEATHAKLREATLKALGERDGLRETAKTAFENEKNREQFEARVNGIRTRYEEALGALITPQQRGQSEGVLDEAMIFRRRRSQAPAESDSVVKRNAVVYVEPGSREPRLYDFVEMVPRKAGWKVHFPKSQSLEGMTGINLIFEEFDRFVLTEWYAYEVYRDSGNAAPMSRFVRLHLGNQLLGYHLLVEQPNKAFLRRNKLNDDGNLYKLGWQGSTLEELHEKKTHPQGGHGDLKELVDRLGATSGDAQWQVIRKEFDLPQVLTYFAVNSVLAHWDGYMNNYFTYHDAQGSGKWQMYPWDQDKTMGFHDGIRGDAVFADLPLNFGATGDKPPGWKGPAPLNFFQVYRRMSGMEWWRQPGPFSGPLIANPQFRKHYASRIKNLLETSFSEKEALGRLEKIRTLLADEVRVRAEAQGRPVKQDQEAFDHNVSILKKFILSRREYLLKQAEVASAAPWAPEALK